MIKTKNLSYILLALLAINILIPFAFVWVPHGLGAEADTIDYRLPLIQWALRHHSYPNFAWTYVDDFPALAEIAMAFSTFFGSWGPRIVSALAYAFFVLGSFRLGQIFLSPLWALATTILISSMSLVTVQDNLMMIDLFASTMSLWSGYYVLRFLLHGSKQKARHLYKAALFSGLALATRYTQIPFVCVYGFLIFVLSPTKKDAVKNVAIFSLIALALLSPWLLRNLIVNHNPLYPLFVPILGGLNFTVERSKEIFGMVQHLHGVPRTPLNYLLMPVYFAFYPSIFDYSVGPQVLVFGPWMVIYLGLQITVVKLKNLSWPVIQQNFRRTLPFWIAFSTFTAWFLVSQDGRFLTHAMPFFVVSGILGIQSWCQKHKLKRFETVMLATVSVMALAGTFKHLKKHFPEFDPKVSHMISQSEVADFINAKTNPEGKILILQRNMNLSLIERDFVFAFPNVYSTSALDFRQYSDKEKFYDDLYNEGVRYLYLSNDGSLQGFTMPPAQSKYIWNAILINPAGGKVYALDKTK